MGAMRIAASFENLTEVRASLEAVADGLGRALDEGIAQDAQPLLATAKALTPYGPGANPRSPATSGSSLPHIRDMLTVTGRGAIAIVASHPGAKVHEWGGTIQPRGAPIEFPERAMARRASVQHLPEIERAVDARIAQLL